jgi:core-2/I-Branching enzyme
MNALNKLAGKGMSLKSRNLVFVRVGDNSLHWSWAVPRAQRNYDLFISYFGSTPGRYREDGEYYETSPGLKLPVFSRLLKKQRELIFSYDAVCIADDDLLTCAAFVNRMFDLFHKYHLMLAQPALSFGSYCAHPVTLIRPENRLHFSEFVETMCPIFSRDALRRLASTFTMSASSWGVDFLWGHRLKRFRRRIAILDEAPVVHSRPVGKGLVYDLLKTRRVDHQGECQKIVDKYKINVASMRSRVVAVVPAGRFPVRARTSRWVSLYPLQERIDDASRCPIFYENRSGKLKLAKSEFPDFISWSSGKSSTESIARLMGSDKRVKAMARDIISHWTIRQTMRAGKAIVVGMDSRVCTRLFRELIRLRPEWKRLGAVALAISTPGSTAAHGGYRRRRFESRRKLIRLFKDSESSLKLLVTDSLEQHDFISVALNTAYVDLQVPVDRHNHFVAELMRLFQDRLATLVVDYFGLSDVALKTNQTPSLHKNKGLRLAANNGSVKGIGTNKAKAFVRLRSRPNTTKSLSVRSSAILRPGQRIAHLFLIRSGLNQEKVWKSFFRGYEPYYSVYVHAKHRNRIASRLLRHNHISAWCETKYADVSLVRAELLLLREALQNKENKFLLLHSESCVPIRSFEFVYSSLFTVGTSRLYSFREDMLRYYGVNTSRIPHSAFLKSSQFFCLTRDHAKAVLENGRIEDWAESECADEHYIPTVLNLSGRLHECSPVPLAYADWDPKRRTSRTGPVVFDKLLPKDVQALRQTQCLFARKFSAESDIIQHVPMLYSRSPGRSICIPNDRVSVATSAIATV